MYTQCPHCQACFEITADQLKIGDGDVRCGQCLSIFNALHYLTESLPVQDGNDAALSVNDNKEAPSDPVHREPTMGDIDNVATDIEPATNTAHEPPTFDEADVFTSQQIESIQFPGNGLDEATNKTQKNAPADRPAQENAQHSPPESNLNADTADKAEAEPPAPDTPVAEPETQPAPEVTAAREIFAEPFIEPEATSPKGDASLSPEKDGPISNLPAPLMRQLQEEKAASLRPPTTPWVIASLLMVVLLLAQGSYFYRDTLAQRQPELRPWLELACGYLDRYFSCNVRRPPSQAKIDILGWDVRSLPDTPQALIASTTLINKNHENQPYPLLTLSFSNINGAPLAQRRFLPREYLPSNTDIKVGMTPDTPVPVELALIDPGKQAVNFEFRTEPGTVLGR